jgi:flagellar basal body-associated protein FliL
MKFLFKIENAINASLIRLGNRMLQLLGALIPAKLRGWMHQLLSRRQHYKNQIKQSPALLKALALELLPKLKTLLQTINIKQKLQHTYGQALAEYNSKKAQQLGHLKKVVMVPVLLFSKWLEGLSVGQSLLLLSFSAASMLAGLNIVSTSQRMTGQKDTGRTPASLEEEVAYDRPGYYKEKTKHLSVTNLRLPVYVAEVNELKSVDIDFTATVSTRRARQFLDKNEWQLRDHLISEMEPLIASFPLEDEGKEVIRHKIHAEINEFLKLHNIDGQVTKLRLTYILAN